MAASNTREMDVWGIALAYRVLNVSIIPGAFLILVCHCLAGAFNMVDISHSFTDMSLFHPKHLLPSS